MNIFIISTDAQEAARFQCDKHVPKLVLESFQLLCAALRLEGVVDERLYKLSHKNNPLVKWTKVSSGNYFWLLSHAKFLLEEYSYRFGNKEHASTRLVELCEFYSAAIPIGPQTPFVLCMPDEHKGNDPVESYRSYYKTKTFAKWNKGRPAPDWWTEYSDAL